MIKKDDVIQANWAKRKGRRVWYEISRVYPTYDDPRYFWIRTYRLRPSDLVSFGNYKVFLVKKGEIAPSGYTNIGRKR